MTHQRGTLFASNRVTGWRGARAMLLAAAIGFGGWQAAQFDWSQAGRALDQALLNHALQDRPAVLELQAAAPVWREREGASGDKIVERVGKVHTADPAVAVIDEPSGRTVPQPVLVKQAAQQDDSASPSVKPARFNGLTAGDRLTITTTGGEVYTFEVVAGRDNVPAHSEMAIRVISPDGNDKTVLYAVRPVAPEEPAAMETQQEL